MSLQIINPLSDHRWDDLVARHPNASPFHHRGWLEALHRTYGYEPLVLTSAAPGEELRDGLVLCKISSWLTGTRLVSVPFADHCDPLLNGHDESASYLQWMRQQCDEKRCKYVETRPLLTTQNGARELQPSRSFCLHLLDTTPTERRLFEGLHKSSVQRKIRRAERERLSYVAGRSEQLQDEFYALLLLTRRRHRLPPQPRVWFRNLIECMGDRALIRVARKDGTPVAALLTLQHGSSVVYKYGCSDAKVHRLGGVALLFWRLIQEGKAAGMTSIDFGRSDMDNQGLITYKDRWGAKRTTLTYYRYPATSSQSVHPNRDSRAAHQLFALLPDALLTIAGRIMYRHMG